MVSQNLIPSLQGRADDVREISGSGLRFERSGFEPRHIEKIANKAVEPLGLLQNGAHEARLNRCIELLSMRDETARRAENGSEGGAQIMRNRRQQAVIRVLDEGEGIPEADLDRIFDKFYRVRRSDRQRAGTGLGLAICRGFVEAMGGSITAANRIDRVGAVFTITLPVPVTPRLSAEALS